MVDTRDTSIAPAGRKTVGQMAKDLGVSRTYIIKVSNKLGVEPDRLDWSEGGAGIRCYSVDEQEVVRQYVETHRRSPAA